MNRAELKAAARAQIAGKIGILFVITLIIGIITVGADLILSCIPYGSLIMTFIIAPGFALSTVRIYLSLFGDRRPDIGDTFSGFNDFWGAFKVSFLVGLFTFLWSLLFIIPGIIKSYSYSMSMYVLAENKGKPALECMEESCEMTDGHKMELFVLDLSFIGWILLGIVTLGIAYIWVVPYYNATRANAYRALKPTPRTSAYAAEGGFAPAADEPPHSRPTQSADNSFKNI